MAHIDSYLSRVLSENGLSFLDDLYELYDFVPNETLHQLLAAFHTGLNKWFTVINSDLRYQHDEEGNIKYTGGYFHAQDSRDYLALIDVIDTLKSKLKSTEYSFRLCSEHYDDIIRRCRRFVVKSGGSTIPRNFLKSWLFAPLKKPVKSGVFSGSKIEYFVVLSVSSFQKFWEEMRNYIHGELSEWSKVQHSKS